MDYCEDCANSMPHERNLIEYMRCAAYPDKKNPDSAIAFVGRGAVEKPPLFPPFEYCTTIRRFWEKEAECSRFNLKREGSK